MTEKDHCGHCVNKRVRGVMVDLENHLKVFCNNSGKNWWWLGPVVAEVSSGRFWLFFEGKYIKTFFMEKERGSKGDSKETWFHISCKEEDKERVGMRRKLKIQFWHAKFNKPIKLWVLMPTKQLNIYVWILKVYGSVFRGVVIKVFLWFNAMRLNKITMEMSITREKKGCKYWAPEILQH